MKRSVYYKLAAVCLCLFIALGHIPALAGTVNNNTKSPTLYTDQAAFESTITFENNRTMPKSMTSAAFSGNAYYNQLDRTSQKIYTELFSVLKEGIDSFTKNTDDSFYSYQLASCTTILTGTAVKTADSTYTYSNQLTADYEAYKEKNYHDIMAALWALNYDHPEIDWLNGAEQGVSSGAEISLSSSDGVQYTATFTCFANALIGDLPWQNQGYKASAFTDAVDHAKAQILAKAPNTDYDITLAIHDYLCHHISYAASNLDNPKYQTAYSALVEQVTVCAGYAKSFKILCDQFSIPCLYVSGTGRNQNEQPESHAWNYVRLAGNWYAVDCTWDDQSEILYDFFLVGSNTKAQHFHNQTFAQTHVASGNWGAYPNEANYPVLSETAYTPNTPNHDLDFAQAVDAKIQKLPGLADLTLQDEPLVAEVRQAYDALTEEQKLLVLYLAELVAAEEKIDDLKNTKPQFISGDVNGDKKVNANDALWVLQAAVHKRELDKLQTLAGDMDQNNVLNATDALIILKIAVGK